MRKARLIYLWNMSVGSSYRSVFTKDRRRSLYVAILIFALSLIFQYYASIYSAQRATQFVGDIILDNTPVVNLNLVIIEGALWAILMSAILVFSRPKYLTFTLKTVAVFLTVRSFFVAVTHLGIYPDQLIPGNGFFDQVYVSFGLEAGYFFSAHTGLPLLMGLIFWRERFWRWLYITISALFGISVLLAHVHYSIDVFAAPFMVYSIIEFSKFLFKEDYALAQV